MNIIKESPVLHAETRTGKKKYWQGFVIENMGDYFTQTCYWQDTADGESTKQFSEAKYVKPTNIGRANEKNSKEQALFNLESMIVKRENVWLRDVAGVTRLDDGVDEVEEGAMSERLSQERLEEIAARAEAASYDHEHDCDHYEYAQEDGRCYRHESGELCRYEPKCHDSAIRHSLKPSLVPHGRLAADVPALLAHIDALEAENEQLRDDAEQWRKHEYGVARACEQGMADLARLAALEAEVWGE